MRRFLTILIICLSLLPLNSCQALSIPSDRGWMESDLRWLGNLDAPAPATDILAVYTRTTSLTVDMRVDLLDINPGDQVGFRLRLWDNNVFTTAPFEVFLDADGSLHAGTVIKQGAPQIWPRVIKDYDLDTITVSINRFLLGDHYQFDVSTLLPGSEAPVDKTSLIRSDGLPPIQRAPYLVAFTDTFPVETPAQALKRWDGAHSGPLDNRNGLKYVLQAASQYNIPIALLDLKTPPSLAALNYMGDLGLVQYLSQRGLLILPDVVWSRPEELALAFSRRAGVGFGLPGSSFIYDPSNEIHSGYAAKFVGWPSDRSRLEFLDGGTRVIPSHSFLPFLCGCEPEATEDGPSLGTRRALVNVMLSDDPANLIILGGSLSNTPWSQPDRIDSTFQWLDGHPWLRRLGANDLLTFPASKGDFVGSGQPLPYSHLVDELRSAPANAAGNLAWEMFLELNQPADPSLLWLRKNYLGGVEDLLAAARWAEKPSAQAYCANVNEAGGQTRCILSNQNYFAILESSGARLTFLFYRDANGLHQIVGPTSQFAVGLSDPSEWNLEAGEAADPSVIPGGFTDTSQPWLSYQSSIKKTGIAFTSADGERAKTFRLTENGLEVEYQLSGSETTQLPLAVDPQAYDFSPVFYQSAIGVNSWTWGQAGGIQVQVSSDTDLSAQGFNASYPFLFMPEDPNLDYPHGHYLPFPLSLVTVQAKGNFKVDISVK